ncbi:hypothetical protein [Peribacillus simplex]|uniref:NAD-dependent epimerase/dehydratase domain-containing protein n=2 Tax=Peribacillus simplex TaxID=1478 RepID=A0A223EE92_9BACI|nr:hypothetical protein [Peribacillus simplex]ASS93567.1 hypothetical protein BS1321_06045 [Peribacillus simplex NBRC 15720 = DSM 1321]MEC1399245.1 hypothetical protein [Peribacillus simplex]TVX83218.1 hypothetical protein FQP34_06545 [Peribacillus simplex]
MQTNIVIGTYRFVGFYVTQYLLNQGEEVIGIDWADSEASQYIMEEKELEIGRNSNYIYFPINKLKLLDIKQQDTVFISCYDIQSGKMDKIDFVIGEIVSLIEKCKKNGKNETPNFVLFMPIEKDVSIFQYVLSSIRGIDSAKIIFLPTIYGPWQSEGMSFEAGINQLEQSDIKAAIAAEYTGDALYITDFVNALEEVTSSSDRDIQLCSSIDDHWNKCAMLIFGESMDSVASQSTTKINKGTIFEVKSKLEPEEGIALQRKHNKRLNLLKTWRKRD